MHAERDIVLPILSVRLSNAGIVCKRMDIYRHVFLTFWEGHRSCCLHPSTVKKF